MRKFQILIGFKEADRGVNSILPHVRSCELRKLGTKQLDEPVHLVVFVQPKQLNKPKNNSMNPNRFISLFLGLSHCFGSQIPLKQISHLLSGCLGQLSQTPLLTWWSI